MAGDIKLQYGTSSVLTVTNLHSLASDQEWDSGWSSETIDNRTNENLDILLSGTFTTHASNRQAGSINVYVYSVLSGVTPTWPDLFSTGTEGTEGAAVIRGTQQRDGGLRLIASMAVDTGASEIYTFPMTSIAAQFGGILPSVVAIFVAQNCSTTTTAGLAAAGSAIYITPVSAQYT